MARNITDVIARILAEVPRGYSELRGELARLLEAATVPENHGAFGWQPPELNTMYWRHLQEVLVTFAMSRPGDRPEWLENARLIFVGEA